MIIDYPPKSGILQQYVDLKGMAENMPVIRKLLGIPEYGRIPNTTLGRTVQRFIDNSRENVLCESGIYKHETIEC